MNRIRKPKPQSFIHYIHIWSILQLLVAQHTARVQERFMRLGKHTYIYIHLRTFTYISIRLHTFTYVYIHLHTFTCFHIHSYLCLDFVQNPLRQSRTNSSHTVLLQPCSLKQNVAMQMVSEQRNKPAESAVFAAFVSGFVEVWQGAVSECSWSIARSKAVAPSCLARFRSAPADFRNSNTWAGKLLSAKLEGTK